MKNVLVTGADGFIGKNLCAELANQGVNVIEFNRNDTIDGLASQIKDIDFVYHLAGVNRPKNEEEFMTGNAGLTKDILALLDKENVSTSILLTSSTQAELDNPYGKSKRSAENAVRDWSNKTGNRAYIYRLPGVFGKWCRPNYNSVVATFCNNIAKDLPIHITDPENIIKLVYIDDVVKNFSSHLVDTKAPKNQFCEVEPTFKISLGELEKRIRAFKDIREKLVVPDLEDLLNKYLYATYISYTSEDDFSYPLPLNKDERGWLCELLKSDHFGQIFISKTKPGISRGNHWHNTKIEKFLVLSGTARIRFRNKVDDQKIITYDVTGSTPTVVDIPTGYVHSIENTGDTELITLFWANEILDKVNPDTYRENVAL